MSLTNIVYTPVDTGTAKVSLNVENTKVRDFYLLAGYDLIGKAGETGNNFSLQLMGKIFCGFIGWLVIEPQNAGARGYYLACRTHSFMG